MRIQHLRMTVILLAVVAGAVVTLTPRTSANGNDSALNDQLSALLNYQGFTGRVGQSLEQRLGRKIDNQLADLGRLHFAWFRSLKLC